MIQVSGRLTESSSRQPRPRSPRLFARVLEILRREHVDLIVPCRDDDVVALAELAEAHPEHRAQALCGPAVLARMMSDKWLSFEFC